MTDKLVSIITPTYHCAEFIGQTIESVMLQTYHNWEMIIVDDCSDDNTYDVVSDYAAKDSRIKYHRLCKNSGAAIARNTAMKLAQGAYIAFLDSDDIWMSEKLEKQLEFMERTGHIFTCTSYEKIDKDGSGMNKTIRAREKTDYNRLLLDCPVGNSTVMYSVEEMGKFEVPDIRKRNDDALWLRMLKREKYIWGMPDVLMKYRVRSNSISSNKLTLIKYHWILYRKIEHLNVFRSVFHICWWCFIKVFRIK